MSGHPPKMDRLLATAAAISLREIFGEKAVKKAFRTVLDELVEGWLSGGNIPAEEAVVQAARSKLAIDFSPPLKRVVNATGVVLHTNLGRALLSAPMLREAAGVLSGYVDLEIDLDSHSRGHRDSRLEEKLRDMLNTDRSVVVVNNNAAAVLLLLNTLSAGRECVVSRGELVEIGGGFRMPEVMKASGARLVEVGTTNRTGIHDFRRAVGPETGALLKVHTSNYRVVGFTKKATLEELVSLGNELGLPVGYDLGSGNVGEAGNDSLLEEPTVRSALAAAPTALCFSADKLFGACQAGILLVDPAMVEAFRSNPLLRALRVDKITYFLLGTVVDLYRKGRGNLLPALSMLALPEAGLRSKALLLRRKVEKLAPSIFRMEVVSAEGCVGAGSAPTYPLPSPALAISASGVKVNELEHFLRSGGEAPILSVVSNNRVLLHTRTILKGESGVIAERLAAFAGRERP